jgi:hypothetical protein
MRQVPHFGTRGFLNLTRLNALTCSRPILNSSGPAAEGFRMLDVVMLAIGLGFFALSIGYTIACDRL